MSQCTGYISEISVLGAMLRQGLLLLSRYCQMVGNFIGANKTLVVPLVENLLMGHSSHRKL